MSVAWPMPAAETPPPTVVEDIDMRRSEWGYLAEILCVSWSVCAVVGAIVLAVTQ